MEVRTDRVGLLVEQLAESMEFSRARMEGMTDDEYLWEPVAGMWSVRPRGEAVTSEPYGPGEWQIDREFTHPFAPGTLTTIAWRLSHVWSCFAGRWEWTFGARSIPPQDTVEFSPHAHVTLEGIWSSVTAWNAGMETLTEEELDRPGYGQYPWGLDPELPVISIARWVNREFIHHMAEVALLRDLYAVRQ
ncbi:MAG: DinB family protein [Acidimicrobiia bacterium]